MRICEAEQSFPALYFRKVAPFYLQNKVKLYIPAQMERSRFSFMFAKDVREALRKQLETATSPTLLFSKNGQKAHNLLKMLRKAGQRRDPFSNFIHTGGYKINCSITTSCWKSQSPLSSLGGKTAPLKHATACLESALGCGMVTNFLSFFLFGYLCFPTFLQWTRTAPVIIDINKKSYGKRKARRLFGQEMAYLEKLDANVGSSGSSCDWPGWQSPGLWEISSMTAAGLWGIPSKALGGLEIWKKV